MLHPDVDIAQWYCAPLPFKSPAIDSGCGLIFFHLFFFSFFLEVQKLIALCLYHFALYMRIYHSIKPYFNVFRFSVKSIRIRHPVELVLLIDFTILDVLIFGSRVFFNLNLFFRPLKQLISIKDRQQLKSKLRAYLICIKFTAHRSSDTFVHNSR